MPLLRSRKQELVFLLIILCTLASLVIWVRTATVKTTYAYVDKEKEWQKVQEQLQDARVRWLKQTSARKLESIAQTLGLQAPQLSQVQKFRVDAYATP